MNHHPSGRSLAGILMIMALIALWAVLVASLAPLVGKLNALVQAAFYLIMGLAWIIPLKPLLRWTQTGAWFPTGKDEPPVE